MAGTVSEGGLLVSEGGLLHVAARRLCYPGEMIRTYTRSVYPGEPFDRSEVVSLHLRQH